MKQSTLLVFAVSAALLGLMASSQGVAEAQNQRPHWRPGSDPVCDLSQRFDFAGALLLRSWMRQPKKPPTRQDRAWSAWSSRTTTPPPSTACRARLCWRTVPMPEHSAPPSGNAQLEDVDGRHIVEHDATSASNVFEVSWTAPAAGSRKCRFLHERARMQRQRLDQRRRLPPATLSLPEVADTSNIDAPQLQPQTGPALCPSEKRGLGRRLKRDV